MDLGLILIVAVGIFFLLVIVWSIAANIAMRKADKISKIEHRVGYLAGYNSGYMDGSGDRDYNP